MEEVAADVRGGAGRCARSGLSCGHDAQNLEEVRTAVVVVAVVVDNNSNDNNERVELRVLRGKQPRRYAKIMK